MKNTKTLHHDSLLKDLLALDFLSPSSTWFMETIMCFPPFSIAPILKTFNFSRVQLGLTHSTCCSHVITYPIKKRAIGAKSSPTLASLSTPMDNFGSKQDMSRTSKYCGPPHLLYNPYMFLCIQLASMEDFTKP